MRLWICVLVSGLGGCASYGPEVPTDRLPELKPGQVLMGFTVDTDHAFVKMRLTERDTGERIFITDVPEGVSVQPLAVEPGVYCVDYLHLRAGYFRHIGPLRFRPATEQCWTVPDEPLANLGHHGFREQRFSDEFIPGATIPDFYDLLEDAYPHIYERYVGE